MGQIKVYAHRATLDRHRQTLSDTLHEALVEAFAYPADKKFQRFLALEDGDFIHPADRSSDYLVIEVVLFPGRSPEAKKAFYRGVLGRLQSRCGLSCDAVEIVLIESAKENWFLRGTPGDELVLNYRVDV
jgi:phenylpyruvate tautomerase PptA (4-oxalocrotonate tautomerase family)